MFLKNHVKRYYIVDFSSATMFIKEEYTQKKEEAKKIAFREILEVIEPSGEFEIKAIKNAPKNHPYPFYLKTKDRTLVLYCQKMEERNMWIDGFNYVVKSTREVQKIIDENNKKTEEDIKKK